MIFQAIVLGIVQGLAEFIPVSSSAHLLIIPQLLNWKPMGLPFEVALHWGTLVALLAYFWRDWVDILGGFVQRVAGKPTKRGDAYASGRLLIPIIVATIPAAVVGAEIRAPHR